MTIQEQIEESAAIIRQTQSGRWPWNHFFRRGVNALMLRLLAVFGTSTIAVSKKVPRLIGLTLTKPEPVEELKGISPTAIFTFRTPTFRRLAFYGQNVVQTPFGRYMITVNGRMFTVRLKVGGAILFEFKSKRPGKGRDDVEEAAKNDFDDRLKRLFANWVTFGGFDSPAEANGAYRGPDTFFSGALSRPFINPSMIDETATTKKEGDES